MGPSSTNEAELAQRARRGDAQAFDELVRPHWDVMFRVAYLITREAAGAEDAAQDALVTAWRALGRFRANEPVRPWLLAIVANEARNRRRAEHRRAGLALRVAAVEPSNALTELSPETVVISAEERIDLLERLAALPEDASLVLACRYLLGLTERETAAAVGIAPGTVKSRTARALARLRDSYA